MNRNIFTFRGTPVPQMIGLLTLLWASGFTGVMYMIYETEAHTQPVSLEAQLSGLVDFSN